MEFREVQKFKQTLIWIIILATISPALYLSYTLYRAGNNPTQTLVASTIAAALIALAILITFVLLRLETTFSATGIVYRFFPVHIQSKTILWSSILSWEVITYSPLAEYGGWGLRFGKNGRALNVSGDQGVRLHLKDGTNILFGTQKPNELKAFLIELKITNFVDAANSADL